MVSADVLRVHQAAADVDVSLDDAFSFMSDAIAVGRWALGCLGLEPDGAPGVFSGTSIFDGSRSWIHIETNSIARVVTYHVGSREQREPRIQARIEAGCDSSARIVLMAERTAEMDDARWNRLCRTHELEVLIIQAQCPAWLADKAA